MANASEVVGDGVGSRRLLRLEDVQDITSLSEANIYRYMKEGTFPRPFRIGKRAVAWRESEIEEWLDQLERATIKNFA